MVAWRIRPPLVYIHLYEMQLLYEVFTRCGALFDGLVSTSYRMVFYTAKRSGKNQLDPFHDGDGEHDVYVVAMMMMHCLIVMMMMVPTVRAMLKVW